MKIRADRESAAQAIADAASTVSDDNIEREDTHDGMDS